MRLATRLIQLLCTVTVAVAAIAPAQADVIALTSTRVSGNQPWTGALGMDFDVLAPVWITRLGAFDSDKDGFVSPIQVGIFNRDTSSLVGASATLTTLNSVLVGDDRFITVAGFMLPTGHYSIVASGFGNTDQNGNAGGAAQQTLVDNGGGAINFIGTNRYAASGSGLVFPTIIDGGPTIRYNAGTFAFSTTAVPEPGSVALLGLGLLGLAATRRRRAS